MSRRAILSLVALAASSLAAAGPAFAAEAASFPAADGLVVSADLYLAHPETAPFVILFHQAGYSRGEYLEIAPRLNALGFNAMAVDQRSGSGVKGLPNQTAARAAAAGKPGGYLDALPDMAAAIAYARAGLARGKLILWGSSYSASLVVKIAGDDPASCDALLAFSPGEYFGKSGFIAASAAGVRVPAFLTSSRFEVGSWAPILEAMPSPGKVGFVPKVSGMHGSCALWSSTRGNEEYWAAVEAFLAGLK